MLWLKALHIIAVICWFAGIFYLPRILVYYASNSDPNTRAQLATMARKLYRFVTPIAVVAIVLGFALMAGNWSYYTSAKWMWAKLVAVLALVIYHYCCGRFVAAVQTGDDRHSHTYFRLFNEVPVIFLVIIVLLVVLKPH